MVITIQVTVKNKTDFAYFCISIKIIINNKNAKLEKTTLTQRKDCILNIKLNKKVVGKNTIEKPRKEATPEIAPTTSNLSISGDLITSNLFK